MVEVCGDAGTTYETSYIAYDDSNDIFYKSVQNSNTANSLTDTDLWTPATIITDWSTAEDTAQSDITTATANIAVTCRLNKCESSLLAKAENGVQTVDNLSNYERLRMKVEGAVKNNDASNVTAAQQLIEDTTDLCTRLDV